MEVKSLQGTVDELKAIGEPTRLRAVHLLSHGELSVGELADVLGQSQPRLSRHMKFLTAAGLVERLPEGAWVFYRIPSSGRGRELVDAVIGSLDPNDPDLKRDIDRLRRAQKDRQSAAEQYFTSVAADWDRIRSLQYPEAEIEDAIIEAAGPGPFQFLVDIGTGTGRMLSLLADRVTRSEGVDLSHEMLNVARANIERDALDNAAVRYSDAVSTPYDDDAADLVIVHQVLHYLDDPARVVSEAGRILRPGGRLLVIDFDHHGLEFLRTEHAHRHLGLSDDQMSEWTEAAALTLHPAHRFDAPTSDGLAVKIWVADKLPNISERAA